MGCDHPKLKLYADFLPHSLNQEVGKIQIQQFDANLLQAKIYNPTVLPLYLFYADGFNPHWQAFVDGERVSIIEKFGFKSIIIPPGSFDVTLRYGTIGDLLYSYGMALCGIGFVLIWLIMFLKKAKPMFQRR